MCLFGANNKPCENGGQIIGVIGACKCLCSVGFIGNNCEIKKQCLSGYMGQ